MLLWAFLQMLTTPRPSTPHLQLYTLFGLLFQRWLPWIGVLPLVHSP